MLLLLLVVHVTTNVRTYPAPEVVEVTVTRPDKRR